jgi:hypothetical protein
MDDFEKADAEAGVEVMEAVPVGGSVVPTPEPSSLAQTNSVVDYRTQLVKDYHKGHESILERLEDENKQDTESLLTALIQEVIKETDHLLGNELIATQNGDHRDSSVISYKRVEAMEKAIKAVTAKRALERESGIDLDSPSMMVIFRFFISKVNDTFVKMNTDDELKDLFFSTFGSETENWKKDMKAKFKELRTGN